MVEGKVIGIQEFTETPAILQMSREKEAQTFMTFTQGVIKTYRG